MSTVSYYTAEGLKKLKEELDYLKNVARPKASADIAEARDKGDLSENAEYDAAKEAQGMLEMRIAKLEEIHSNARLIDESHLDTSKVLVLSNVKIKNQTNGMEMKYTLVAESEADLKTGKISVTSPIGKGLLGKSVGEVAEIIVPNGACSHRRNEVEYFGDCLWITFLDSRGAMPWKAIMWCTVAAVLMTPFVILNLFVRCTPPAPG